MSTISHKDVILTYRAYAPVYDWLFGAVFEPGRQRLTAAVRKLQPRSLLEVGVGTGLTLEQYPAASSIIGIDLSQDMLAKARQRADDLPGRQIQLAVMDAESLDFQDDSFDCVTLPYVLSVTPNPDRLIREARRVCRPGGTIVILNHFSGSAVWWALERVFRSLAKRIGFRPDFRYADHILRHDWEVMSVQSVNLLGLSKFILIRNT